MNNLKTGETKNTAPLTESEQRLMKISRDASMQFRRRVSARDEILPVRNKREEKRRTPFPLQSSSRRVKNSTPLHYESGPGALTVRTLQNC